ncbi:MAG: TniB family NTP-binding protein [Rhodopseudomonas palustris]|nr:TniB family NTP-binding protein [Rhodopseudomonas palustris]
MAFERLHQMRKLIVHFDEMQHVVHNMPHKDLQQMADTLKIAMDDHRITIILSGVETLEPFLQFDSQLLRRFTIVPFEEVKRGNHGDIVHMVESYAKAANLKVKLGDSEEVKADFIARLAHAALNAYGYSIVPTPSGDRARIAARQRSNSSRRTLRLSLHGRLELLLTTIRSWHPSGTRSIARKSS